MSKQQNNNPGENARLAGQLAHLGLNANDHLKGNLIAPQGNTTFLVSGIADDGHHTTIKPKSIQEAKQQVGIPDSLYETRQLAHRAMPEIQMVSPARMTSTLTQDEKCAVEDAAHEYLYGDSSRVAHMESAINTHVIPTLEANVHVYIKLDVKGRVEFAGGGNPIILVINELNFYPGGEFVVTDNSPLTVNATTINYVSNQVADVAEVSTSYDVSIVIAKNHPGQDGQDGTDQIAAGDGAKGADHTSKNSDGDAGAPGGNGQAGGPGICGEIGPSSPVGIFYVDTLNCSMLVQAVGSDGGTGGNGGNGGDGGNGGNGGEGGKKGDSGNGGNGGNGGDGGNGGNGGIGGDGGVVTLYSENLDVKIFDAQVNGGTGGKGGTGGLAGTFGSAGTGHKNGNNGNSGSAGTAGTSGASGSQGSVSTKKVMPPAIDAFSPNQGPIAGGTQITITGKNFFNNSKGECIIQFTINGLQLTDVVLKSQTLATGVTPASDTAAQYPLIAFNIETKSAATGPGYFTYIP